MTASGQTDKSQKNQPEACPKCGAVATLRSVCKECGEGRWVIEHGPHYKWGHEVVPCSCQNSKVTGKGSNRPYQVKQLMKEIRKTGKRPDDPRRPITTPEMAKKAAEGLARGLPKSTALREAGFPPSTVRASGRGINRMIRAELKTLGRKYVEMGRDLSPEDQEAMVRGRLMENTIIGTDKGVLSAKQLGADKRVAMWQPDSQVGLVVLQAPQVRTINHAVPLIPSKHASEETEEEAK